MSAQDRLDILDAVARWSHAVDGLDAAGLRGVVTENAEFVVEGAVVSGADEIVARAGVAAGDAQIRRHVRTTVFDSLDAGTASARTYYLLTRVAPGGRPEPVATGVYADESAHAGGAAHRASHRSSRRRGGTGAASMSVLPRTSEVVEAGLRDGLHVGAQIAVAFRGEIVADLAFGVAQEGVPMTSDSMMIWFSSTKATTAVAVAQQWERGNLGLDDAVVAHVPEFAGGGKDAITIRHLLTHTAGIRFADSVLQNPESSPARAAGGMTGTWDERLARICAASVEPGWVPGLKAGYHPTSGMHLLGEIVRRVDGRPFETYVREEIFVPLGMDDCWIGMPPDRYDRYGDRIGRMHNTQGAAPRALPAMDSRDSAASSVPGAGGRGPMRELVRLYRMLLGGGELEGTRVLSAQTVEAITARHRTGMHDESFGAVVDWGLGFVVDSWHYGSFCSSRTFGHGGAQSSVGFADPEHGLAVAYVCNGMPGPARHPQRMVAISSAIYEDVGLAGEAAPLREKALFRDGAA